MDVERSSADIWEVLRVFLTAWTKNYSCEIFGTVEISVLCESCKGTDQRVTWMKKSMPVALEWRQIEELLIEPTTAVF